MTPKEGRGLLAWLGKLFSDGSPSRPARSHPQPRPSSSRARSTPNHLHPTQTDDGFVEIESLNFLGQKVRSDNQRWSLVYGQISDPNASSRSSDDSTGAAMLFDQGNLACRIDGLCRAEAVSLCDAGLFAVNEWGPAGEFLGPKCRLRVYTTTGEIVYQHRAGASIELPSLSSNGRLLAFHTLGAPQDSSRPADGESVFLIDVQAGSILWQADVPVVWPTKIRFDESARLVIVSGQSDDIYRYSYDGEFFDSDLVTSVDLDRAESNEYGYSLFDRAQAILAQDTETKTSPKNAAKAVELLRSALGKNMSPNTKARAHRIIGELAESQGDLQTALSEYTDALHLNPKIGLKRKVKALKSSKK